MKLVNGLFILSTTLALTSLVQAQTRTWAFSKDTVYEWAPNRDSVSLSNNGMDTLRFDSIGLELIRPNTTDNFQAAFYLWGKQNQSFFLNTYQGKVNYDGAHPNTIAISPGLASSTLVGKAYQFGIEDQLLRVAKSQAFVQGDTLIARLIFMASSGRGRDTLIVKGKQDWPLALRFPAGKFNTFSSGTDQFDLRGRRVERIPTSVKVPRAPVVSPKE